jgi:hypothetical protein
MPDFTPSLPGPLFPAQRLAAVTPSDSTDLSGSRALWVGGAGNVVVMAANDTVAVTLVVPAGTLLPIFARRVMAATTATSIVAMY